MRGRGDSRPRVLRKDRTGANPVTVGVVCLLVVLVACWFAFKKDNPLTTPFKLDAVFQSANGVRSGMPVRIAGVNVGKITGIEGKEGTEASIVSMTIDRQGLPIHKDAELKIRPRIFLEGNYFVELRPGTPSQPEMGSGDTVPVTQTATPVQLDQILTSLQQSTRADLQELLDGFGKGLTRQPTAADDATQDAAVRGETPAESLNDSLKDAPGAAKGAAVVNTALVGDGDDVAQTIAALDRVSRSLDDTATLQSFVSNFNTTLGALADESDALTEAVAELPDTLKTTNAALTSLNAAFPPLRAFSREIVPGVNETQATIDASLPWVRQATALLSPAELQGLAKTLKPATRDLARAADGTLGVLAEQDLLAQCVTKVLLPTGDVVIEDGPRSNGVENYKEFFSTLVGFAGESQNFDGNGQFTRVIPSGGSNVVKLGSLTTNGLGLNEEPLYANAVSPPRGTRPALPARRPPQKFDEDCKSQTPPDLNSARSGGADGSNSTLNAPLLSSPPPATATTPTAPLAARRGGGQPDDDSVASALLDALNPLRGDAEVDAP